MKKTILSLFLFLTAGLIHAQIANDPGSRKIKEADGARATIKSAKLFEIVVPNESKWLESSQYHARPANQQNVIAVDDFVIPTNKEWEIDSIQATIGYFNELPDRYRMDIYNIDTANDAPDTVIHSINFTVNLPNPSQFYAVNFNLTPNNINLKEGTYGFSMVGEYDAGEITDPSDTTAFIKRLDTAITSYGAMVRDSIERYYGSQTDWIEIDFGGSEKPVSSLEFTIFGTESTPTGVKKPIRFSNGSVQVFPNPASKKVHFQLRETMTAGAVEVYNASGQLVDATPLSRTNRASLDVSAYERGIYFYKLRNAQETIIETGKFTTE